MLALMVRSFFVFFSKLALNSYDVTMPVLQMQDCTLDKKTSDLAVLVILFLCVSSSAHWQAVFYPSDMAHLLFRLQQPCFLSHIHIHPCLLMALLVKSLHCVMKASRPQIPCKESKVFYSCLIIAHKLSSSAVLFLRFLSVFDPLTHCRYWRRV